MASAPPGLTVLFPEGCRPRRTAGTTLSLVEGTGRIAHADGTRTVTVDALTATLWERLDGTVSLGDMADDLVAVAGGDRPERLEQLGEMLTRLHAESVIEIDHEHAPPHQFSQTAWPAPVMTADEPTYDYMVLPSEPNGPVEGMLQSVNVLMASVGDTPAIASWRRLTDSLRAVFGESRVVWAMKASAGAMSWELYFYRQSPPTEITYEMVRSVLAPHMDWRLNAEPPGNYGLISVDIAMDEDGVFEPVDAVDAYFAYNSVQRFHSACYRLDNRGLVHKNVYHYYAIPSESDGLEDRLANGAFIGVDLGVVEGYLEKYAASTNGIFVATKPRSESVYAGGLTLGDVTSFVDDQGFPPAVAEFFHGSASRLGHLRYDLGFDLSIRDGNLRIVKAIVFGVL